MRSARVLIIMAAALALAACGSDKKNNDMQTPPPGTSTFLASGGTSTSGTGGMGGYVNIQSSGAVKVLRSDTVNASSIPSVALPAPSFGTDPYIVSGGTMTVLLDADESGVLCTFYGDANLYIGDGDGFCDGNDTMVTGLTIDAGATLVLVDQGYWGGYGTLWLSNDLVVNGTITSTAPSVYIEANMIDVESAGKIVTSATTMDTTAGSIILGCGAYWCQADSFTNQITNRGAIEAKGLGNGSGGYILFEPNDLVANYGTIDASGGNSTDADSIGGTGGSGGELDVYVDYGDFYSSGVIRMNGGKGDTDGGDSEAEWGNYNGYSVYVETAYVDNTAGRGDIIISGTWEANGGDGSGSDGVNGRGGYGGWIYLQTDAMGAVMIDATMSARGGNALAAGFAGGNANYSYGIDIYSYNYRTDPATPGKISIAGKYDLRGGNGDEMGGNGGYLYIYSNGYNSSNKGPDIELVGFPTLIMNGGDGANGGSASGSAFQLFTNSPGGQPAGPITNEANIEARGGNATATAFSTGGSGGYVQMGISGIGNPAEVINNSGSTDISGGSGDNGGSSNMVYLWAQHVTNSGALMANGGSGTTAGGSGGNIALNSLDMNTTNTGTLSVAGGTGATPLDSGSEGSVTIDTGGSL